MPSYSLHIFFISFSVIDMLVLVHSNDISQAKRTLTFPIENEEPEADNVTTSTNDPKRQKPR
jgi:hypothetical protein